MRRARHTNNRKKENSIVGLCNKCGGPLDSVELQQNLPNDDLYYFLVSKYHICRWCGRKTIVNNSWV